MISLIPRPESLSRLHGRVDEKTLLALLPLLLQHPNGFTAIHLAKTSFSQGLFPDLDEGQATGKVRRALRVYLAIEYVARPYAGWYIPDVARIQAECAGAREGLILGLRRGLGPDWHQIIAGAV